MLLLIRIILIVFYYKQNFIYLVKFVFFSTKCQTAETIVPPSLSVFGVDADDDGVELGLVQFLFGYKETWGKFM